MAGIFSRIGFSKKPNSKIYTLNSAASEYSYKNLVDANTQMRSDRSSVRASYASSIHHLHRRSSNSICSGYSGLDSWKERSKDDLFRSEMLESQSVKVLENYAVCKAERTTNKLNGCLKTAEELSEGASRLLVSLHKQGEQITQTHQTAATVDHVLQRGEKLLGSLGGLFSRRWKPRKTREIKGPIPSKDEFMARKGSYMDQWQKLGLNPQRLHSNSRRSCSERSSAFERIELEKAKQDDAISELSNLLGKLKTRAADLGSELERQHKSLDHIQDDVDELNIRMKGANHRARQLLRR